jgi:hypothetical protein
LLRRSGASPNGPIQFLRHDTIAPGIFIRAQLRTLCGNFKPRHDFLDIEIPIRRRRRSMLGLRLRYIEGLIRDGFAFGQLHRIEYQPRIIGSTLGLCVKIFGDQIVFIDIFEPASRRFQCFRRLRRLIDRIIRRRFGDVAVYYGPGLVAGAIHGILGDVIRRFLDDLEKLSNQPGERAVGVLQNRNPFLAVFKFRRPRLVLGFEISENSAEALICVRRIFSDFIKLSTAAPTRS